MGYAEEGKSINAQYIADLDKKIKDWHDYKRGMRIRIMLGVLCVIGIAICFAVR